MRLAAFGVTVVASWLLIMGCGPHASSDLAKRGGRLRIGIFYKPTEINPITTDSSISANILDLVFNTLVRLSDGRQIKPELADRWDVSADGLVWIFHLRDHVFFHDGQRLTSRDVKFTYDKVIELKKGGYIHSLKFIREIRAPDPLTVEFHLSQPDQLLWDALGVVPIGPRHLLEGRERFDEYNAHPIGSGPYLFVRQNENEIALKANDQYFRDRPYLDGIEFKILKDQQACLSGFIVGDVDMIFLLNPEDYGALEQIPYLKIYDNWYPLLYMLTLNLKEGLFKSSLARRALNLAVDRQLIVDRVLKGKGTLPAGTVVPEKIGDRFHAYGFRYQPDLAVKLLSADGWKIDPSDYVLKKNGKKFRFTALTFEGHDSNTRVLQLMQEQLREVGIQMDIQVLSFENYVTRIFQERKFEANLVYQIYRPFSDNDSSFWHSDQIEEGLNYSSYRNPDVDASLDRMRFSSSPHDQEQAYFQFQTALYDDPPGIFLFWREMPIAVHRRFKGVPERRMESLRDLVNVWEDQSVMSGRRLFSTLLDDRFLKSH